MNGTMFVYALSASQVSISMSCWTMWLLSSMKKWVSSNFWHVHQFVSFIVMTDLHINQGFFNQQFHSLIYVQIVDSIMALFRVDFSGRGELADRQQKLAQMLSRLQKISEGIE